MRTLLAVVGDGTATPVLETALLAARKFDGRVIGLNALTTEYAVVFGGEMGFSVSSEVDRVRLKAAAWLYQEAGRLETLESARPRDQREEMHVRGRRVWRPRKRPSRYGGLQRHAGSQ